MLLEIVDAYAKSGGSEALVGDVGVNSAISYRYTPGNGLITVSARSNGVQNNGRQNEGRVVADSRFAFGSGCSIDVEPPELRGRHPHVQRRVT